MRKRLITTALLLALALTLGGCAFFGGGSDTPDRIRQPVNGTVQPASLSEPETELLGLVADERWQIYDFFAPGGANRLEFTVWELREGEWERLSFSRLYLPGGRQDGYIAVRFDLDTLSLEYSASAGTELHSPQTELAVPAGGVSWGSSAVADRLQPLIDEPVALILISGALGDTHELYDPQYGFENPVALDSVEAAFVLTLEFCPAN